MALVSSSPSFLQRIGETSAAVRVVDDPAATVDELGHRNNGSYYRPWVRRGWDNRDPRCLSDGEASKADASRTIMQIGSVHGNA